MLTVIYNLDSARTIKQKHTLLSTFCWWEVIYHIAVIYSRREMCSKKKNSVAGPEVLTLVLVDGAGCSN